jgi:peptide chain release factor subunit 1
MQQISDIEKWKYKKLLKNLQAAKGDGTSMITLVVASKSAISQASTMLTEELGTAENIKSRVNKLSVISAIVSTQQALKKYSRTPPNGLVIFCGDCISVDEDGSTKEKKIKIILEPPIPITTSYYKCDDCFHTELLDYIVKDDETYGYIVFDGSCALFAMVSGSKTVTIRKDYYDPPKKHNKGGQSSNRFARLRTEAIDHIIKNVAENCTRVFIQDDAVNVKGIILAGRADKKDMLEKSDFLDRRIKSAIIKTIDVQYSGEIGLLNAVKMTSDVINSTKLGRESKLLSLFFETISRDGNYCIGINDTIMALEMGAIQKLIVYDELDYTKYVVSKDGEDNKIIYKKGTDVPKDVTNVESVQLMDYFVENYDKFGATLEIVSGNTSDGHQFVKAFDGIGGILKWKVDFHLHEEPDTTFSTIEKEMEEDDFF